MLNYGNRLVLVTYCIEFESLIQLDAESPTINKEISITLAALVFTVLSHNKKKSSLYDISYVHIRRNIKHLLIQLIQLLLLIQLSIY